MPANLTPEADIAADEPLVARLIAEQHPDLFGPLRLVSDGWDNRVFRLGDALAVRLPRREAAAHLVEHEQQALPAIAARVGVPVPAPVRVGVPSATFPWAWSILPWFDGVDGAALDGAGRARIAEELAAFVGRLQVPAPPDAPRNPVRGVPLATRDAAVRERLDRLSARLDVGGLRSAWEEALAAPVWDGPALWLHGDLHPGNLLLTGDGRLAAVLDFGDVTAGDPATDLATAWLTFDAAGREAFRAALPQPPDAADTAQWAATWTRARGWAVAMGSALAAHSDDNPRMASLGAHALTQLT